MRREFLARTIKFIALAGAGAATFKLSAWQKNESKVVLKKDFFLRPPGVKNEAHFLSNCIRCAQCVIACPFETLFLASAKDAASAGTPMFVAKNTPCYLCDDLPCVAACPTNALDKNLISKNIDAVNIGKAVLDISSCVAHFGIQCDACYRACPLIDRAIRLEYKRNERTNKHAMLVPVVDNNVCVGCGMCEHACITDKPAIVVLPNEFVLGERNKHYVKGWEKDDDKRLKDIDTSKKVDEHKALDYLNDWDL